MERCWLMDEHVERIVRVLEVLGLSAICCLPPEGGKGLYNVVYLGQRGVASLYVKANGEYWDGFFDMGDESSRRINNPAEAEGFLQHMAA